MKIWLAYKFRGADLNELRITLERLIFQFKEKGHEVFTMIESIQNWDSECLSKDQAVEKAIEIMKSCDLCLCIYETDLPSEGRGWDAGFFAGSGKPTIMVKKRGVNIRYTEALFRQNSANKNVNIQAVNEYDELEQIVELFSAN
jgi:nucleoside 2-deoxyribosyltransferase